MKKNLKKVMLGLALMASMGGAYATVASHAPKTIDTKYDWESTSISPSNPNSEAPAMTREEAVDYFGCDEGATLCASGERVSGTGDLTAELKFGL